MKLLTTLTQWKARLSTASDLTETAATAPYPALKGKDKQILINASASLDEQIHAVINKNADGVNNLATDIRNHTDMLMSLGISDALVNRAGSLAQIAVELANSGRGFDLSNVKHSMSVSERANCVAKAQAIVTMAETLLKKATKANKANIDLAIEEKSRAINTLRTSGLTGRTLTITSR